jgi:hypothetical protein
VAKTDALPSCAMNKATLLKAALIPEGENDSGLRELGASGNGFSARLASLRTISI